MKKVQISAVHNRCVYINDFRVCGGKPYVSENLKHDFYEVELVTILDRFNLDDIEEYMKYKKGLNK